MFRISKKKPQQKMRTKYGTFDEDEYAQTDKTGADEKNRKKEKNVTKNTREESNRLMFTIK